MNTSKSLLKVMNEYVYDNLGNRVGLISNNNETKYQYNELSQLIKEENIEGIKEYQYSSNGNLEKILVDGKIEKEFIYNVDNRMIKARDNNNEVDFVYDSFNKLIEKRSNKNSYEYIVDHLKPYQDIIGYKVNNEQVSYLYDGLGLINKDNEIVLLDNLGSNIINVASEGTITKRNHYDEFGNSDDIKDNEIGYTGYLYDEISKLNYAQARFYDSRSGRFNGLDNIVNNDETVLGFNRYVYVDNDPLNYVDKDGNIKSPSVNNHLNNDRKKIKERNPEFYQKSKLIDVVPSKYSEFYTSSNTYTFTETSPSSNAPVQIKTGNNPSVNIGKVGISKGGVSVQVSKNSSYSFNFFKVSVENFTSETVSGVTTTTGSGVSVNILKLAFDFVSVPTLTLILKTLIERSKLLESLKGRWDDAFNKIPGGDIPLPETSNWPFKDVEEFLNNLREFLFGDSNNDSECLK